ncbi:MAG: hypothetical protein ABSE76_02560 [Minisyncoccia bacterium]|jgi:hypothetical protein
MFSADFLNLIFYCAQQLGVTLGVGAETIMLAAYLISMRDGIVDEKETQYALAIKRVMAAALWLIVLSGLGIAVLHLTAGESAVVFAPAFLFKWVLILLVVALTSVRRTSKLSIVEGVIGGTWYALFLVHILAPVTTWANLGTFYAAWLIGFVLCWEAIVVIRRDRKMVPRKKPAPLPPPPPVPEPVSLPKDFIPPKEIKIIPDISAPSPTTPTSPAPKVTDTPFLPKVPALQPISEIVQVLNGALTVMPNTSAPSPEPKSALSTLPGGTSAMALNVMPKTPGELEAKK